MVSPKNKRELYDSTSNDHAPAFGSDEPGNTSDDDYGNTDNNTPNEDYLEEDESVDNLPAKDMNEM